MSSSPARASAPARAMRVHSPMMLQMESTECGAACLGIVLAHHGRWVPLSTLRAECGVSRDGSKASSVVKVARTHGMEATGYKKSIEALRALPPPFIVFWQFNHFLVVDGFDGDVVHLNDPAFGHRTVSVAELDRDFTGVTLVMSPGPRFERAGSAPSALEGLTRRLAGYRGALAFVATTALLGVLPAVSASVFLQVFVDEVLGGRQTRLLPPMLVLLASVVALQLALGWMQSTVLRRVQLALAARESQAFLAHLLRLPVSFHSQRSIGELASRVGLNTALAEAAGGQLAVAAVDSLTIGVYGLVMVWYDAWLTAFAGLGAVVGVLGMRSFTRARVEAQARHLQIEGRELSVAVAGLRDLETVKASGLETDLFVRWASELAASISSEQALSAAGLRLSLWAPTFAAVTAVLVLVVGGWRVMEGSLTLGVLIGFQGLLLAFYAPLTRLLARATELQSLAGDIARLDDVLRQPVPTPIQTLAPPFPPVEGRVDAHGVEFAYSGVGAALIRGLDLHLRPGQWTAFVGASGSGKSTMLRILAGLYAPSAGQVLVDGVALEAWPRAVLAERLAFVDQDIVLFAGTVRENLSLWDTTISDAALERACADAEVLDVVRRLPGGLDAVLPEGAANLSGGERQRLELARALVRDPAVLLLDEATSALDAETERRVIARLRARGCTVVMAAHRLSTVRDCDELLVMAEGAVLERGTHAALSTSGGPYARLLAEETEA